ncbi:hypothetical protein BKA67DRAFT_566299 [Truncatella angustata]|uniref:Uncharacterized protein n=1 Tax=Truncatella angustata TaxID=152316 RepID=A0A9P8UMC4_9PEZI|nr:uncharacterized protein BKA67DRAFT_566299 [Truncatella angustata]KAH6654823.1 hypothetical protein BKA67DRAFT_566299 [Truncatella angustata]
MMQGLRELARGPSWLLLTTWHYTCRSAFRICTMSLQIFHGCFLKDMLQGLKSCPDAPCGIMQGRPTCIAQIHSESSGTTWDKIASLWFDCSSLRTTATFAFRPITL